MVVKVLFGLLLAVLLLVAAVWYYEPDRLMRPVARTTADEEPADDAWLDHLYSQNPRDTAEAVQHVQMLGARAVPIITATLENPAADEEHRRAALKAAGILGETAAPAIPLVASELVNRDVTAEAAVALSFMGRQSFVPLREALDSSDPVVRREALRSIGKLKERASLDTGAVVPLLVAGLRDPDSRVRAVAATYLGIIREGERQAVPALIEALKDPAADVRRASAEALGSFGEHAAPALPALRKTTADNDPDVSREAGLAIVKLQSR